MAKVKTADGEVDIEVGESYTDSKGDVYFKTLYGVEVTRKNEAPTTTNTPTPQPRSYPEPTGNLPDYTGRTVCADDKCQTRVRSRINAYNQGKGPPPVLMSQLQQRIVNERTVGSRAAQQNARTAYNQVEGANFANSGYANKLATDYMRENPYLDYDTALAIAISRIAEDNRVYGTANNLNRRIDPNFRRSSEKADSISLALGVPNKIENNPTLNNVPANNFYYAPNPDGSISVIDREGSSFNATPSEITALQEINTSSNPNATLRGNYGAIAGANRTQSTAANPSYTNPYRTQTDYERYLKAVEDQKRAEQQRLIDEERLRTIREKRELDRITNPSTPQPVRLPLLVSPK
ncbi:MAG: hypothetical protein [Caudoviricetes sp.]|nr:MAG: hypothetical protein [Caudoviricetes sp.]